jgi:hypothetical protein
MQQYVIFNVLKEYCISKEEEEHCHKTIDTKYNIDTKFKTLFGKQVFFKNFFQGHNSKIENGILIPVKIKLVLTIAVNDNTLKSVFRHHFICQVL